MAYRRGFKTQATELANEVRGELGLGPLDALAPRALAEHLAIPIYDLSSLRYAAPGAEHLLTAEPEVFSAVTVVDGPRRAIVHNDGHAEVRQNSNISHELSHGLLHHPPTPGLDDTGCRIWNQDVEDEASWLAGCLLVTAEAASVVARGRWDFPTAAQELGVSEPMLRYRVNVSGAATRARRSLEARRTKGTRKAR